MRVSREQAEANRNRVIDVASRLFRERGFDGIGVADLMREAGLTHGGFYGQFASKDDLAAQACRRALDTTAERWREIVAAHPDEPLEAIVRGYLSPRHRDGAGQGCAYAALAADVARHDAPALKRAFADGLLRSIELVAGLLPGRSKEARRRKAIARLSAMIGALVMARAVGDPELSEEILAAVRDG